MTYYTIVHLKHILLTSATLINSIKTVVPRALGHAGWSYISQSSCNITVILRL